MLSGTHEDERQQWTWHFLQFLPLLAALAGRAFCQKSGRRPEFLFLSHQGFTNIGLWEHEFSKKNCKLKFYQKSKIAQN